MAKNNQENYRANGYSQREWEEVNKYADAYAVDLPQVMWSVKDALNLDTVPTLESLGSLVPVDNFN